MSKGESEELEWETPPPQPEYLPLLKVSVGLGLTVALFAFSCYLAWLFFAGMAPKINPGYQNINTDLRKEEINIVDQELFELETRAYRDRHEKENRLNSYGWVDRSKGIIHEPIDRAMDEVVEEEAARRKREGAP